MKKTDVLDALHTIKEANQRWTLARARFNSATDTLMFRLIHEATKNFMAAEDIASASGWSTKKVKEHMRGMHLDPRDGIMLLSRKAAEALATNSALMGIEPSEMDLMSPLAYLPMGDAMKRDLAAAAASQVHEFLETEAQDLAETLSGAWQAGCNAGENYQRGGPDPVNPYVATA